MIKVTYFLEVISSWCYWAEPNWAKLKEHYANRCTFDWKIALMDASGLPSSRQQAEWFYRRSGTIVNSPFMLNSGWYQDEVTEYLAPNLIAEAAKDFGFVDDKVRLAIADAALRTGAKVGDWKVAVSIAAQASGLDEALLLQKAQSAEVEARARASTNEFHSLKVAQRPTFVLESGIGDRAVFSGLASIEPLIATIEAMLHDEAAYESWAAHFGPPPVK
ncbi:MAG: DsbA family protein [Verrucomicrobiota bacterium]|nr:DsbA family protein [Verrucomicrobiota bacterium]